MLILSYSSSLSPLLFKTHTVKLRLAVLSHYANYRKLPRPANNHVHWLLPAF